MYARAFLMSGRCRSASSASAGNVATVNSKATRRRCMGSRITNTDRKSDWKAASAALPDLVNPSIHRIADAR